MVSFRLRLLFWVVAVMAVLFVVFLAVLPLQYKLPRPIPLPKRGAGGVNGTLPRTVPRIIHQTWKTGASPPAETTRWREGCQALNREYEFRMYDDDDLLAFTEQHYPEYLALFKSLRGVYMADMARILVTYHTGGIYMDLDFYCHRPFSCLDALVTRLASASGHKHVLAVSLEPSVHATIFRNKERVVIQDFYMATPKHPFFKWFLDNRKAAFERDPLHPAKGPFSYSIEADIDAYRAAKVTDRRLQREARAAALEATDMKRGGPVKFARAGAENSTLLRPRGGRRGRGPRGAAGALSLESEVEGVDLSEGAIVELSEDVLHALVGASL